MMCQHRFVNCTKHATLVADVDNGEAMPVWGQRVYEKSVNSAQCFCEPKTALKIKSTKN